MKVLKFLGILTLLVIAVLTLLLYEGDIPKDVVDARYTSIDSQFADMGELGRIHYRDQGNRRAETLVLIHGANASLHTFEPWVAILEKDFRILTIDMPGHGLTGETPSANYSGQAMLEVIHRLTQQLGMQRFVIGGNSMGGGIAWRYALTYPEDVSALVLIDASGARQRPDPNADTEVRQQNNSTVLGFALLKQPWFRALAERLDPYYLIVQGLNASHYQSGVVDEALIMRYYDLILRQGTRRAILDRVKQSDYSSTLSSALSISDLNIPTLIMWGKEDAVIPFAYASEFESALPDATTAYYDEVGHIPMEEAPEKTAADLKRFLVSLQTQTSEPEDH